MKFFKLLPPPDYATEYWINEDSENHREDGPAVIYNDGGMDWAMNDEYHRTDGPAVIFPNGNKSWYINGIPMWTAKQFQDQCGHSDEYMAELLLKYGPIK